MTCKRGQLCSLCSTGPHAGDDTESGPYWAVGPPEPLIVPVVRLCDGCFERATGWKIVEGVRVDQKALPEGGY